MKLFGYRIIKEKEYQELRDKLSNCNIFINHELFSYRVSIEVPKVCENILSESPIELIINDKKYIYKKVE